MSSAGTVSRLADVAQLVERNLAKVEVAGSNLVVRSRISCAAPGSYRGPPLFAARPDNAATADL